MTSPMRPSPRTEILKILSNQKPSRFVYAPNYWQWFTHQKKHHLLPGEIKHCETQLDLLDYLGVDIFSRNIYSDPENYWFGGLCEEYFENTGVTEQISYRVSDKVKRKEYFTDAGKLTEELVYVFQESTLVQKEFLVKDYSKDYEAFRKYVKSRKWRFNKQKFEIIRKSVGEKGMVIAGEFFSPLKMLHFTLGPINSVYFLMECPDQSSELLSMHETAQLECLRQCVENRVKVIMSMDNLDTMFHPPDYVREFSSSFYKKASTLCHQYGAKFFIHACGNQKDNLELISSYQVDGLEGVAFPPLGDVELDKAMELTSHDFIITGGISAMETRDLKTKKEIYNYVEQLFRKMIPFKNRFVFSSSCNTAIDTSWETIKYFRDAWLRFRDM
jgi:hypothetical protein